MVRRIEIQTLMKEKILTSVYRNFLFKIRETIVIMLCLLCVVGIDWIEYKRSLKKAEQWNVEVY